jgi:hypothetical protein
MFIAQPVALALVVRGRWNDDNSRLAAALPDGHHIRAPGADP